MVITFDLNTFDKDGAEKTVEIDAVFSGRHIPAKRYPIEDAHPEEWPELGLEITYNDIPFRLSPEEEDRAEFLAWEKWDEESKEWGEIEGDAQYEIRKQRALDDKWETTKEDA